MGSESYRWLGAFSFPLSKTNMKIAIKKIIWIFVVLLVIIVLGWVLFNKTESGKNGEKCEDEYSQGLAESPDLQSIFSKKRDFCYAIAARENQDQNLCNSISDESIKKLCPVQVYFWNKSIENCEADKQRDICLHVVSIKKHDKGICAMIKNQSIKSLCNNEE